MNVVTPLLKSLAPIIRTDYFILGVCAFLALWSIGSARSLFRASHRLATYFRSASDLLGSGDDSLAFASNFESVSARLGQNPLLGRPWKGFEHSLIKPVLPGRPVIATSQPRTWFDLAALFRQAGADLRYHAALPGLLVGAGLLVTFVGLAVALSSAASIVGGDEASRNTALQDMLGAASVKFITSLAGLLMSILYALFRKRQLKAVELAFDRFNGRLLELMPLKTAATLQAEGNELLERQYSEFQRIETDFFVNVGQAFEGALSPALSAHIAPLAEAIDKLSAGLASQNEDALGTMLSAFVERLEGAVGDSVRGTADTLRALGSRLDAVQGGLEAAAVRMGRAAEEMATGLGKGAEVALGGLVSQTDLLVSGMRAATDEAGRGSRAASDELVRRLADTATGLSDAAASFQRRLEQGAADGVGRLAAPLEAMLARLGDLTEGQRRAGEDSSAALAATIGRAAIALEGTASKAAAALESGAGDASARLVAATEAMRDDLRIVLLQFGATLDKGGAAFADGAVRGGQVFAGEMATAAGKLREAGEAAGTALREGGAEARSGMANAAGTLASGSEVLAGRLVRLAEEGTALGQRVVDLDRAMGSAVIPLTAGATELRAAGEAARSAVEPLGRAADAVRAALEGVGTVATALEAAQRQTEALAHRMGEATNRFEGVDRGIAEVVTALGTGIEEMQRRMTTYVTGMDQGLADSVRTLSALVRSLEDTISEMHEQPERLSA